MPPPVRLLDFPPSYTQSQISNRLDRFGEQANGQLDHLCVKNYNKSCAIPMTACGALAAGNGVGIMITSGVLDALNVATPAFGCGSPLSMCLTTSTGCAALGAGTFVGLMVTCLGLHVTYQKRQELCGTQADSPPGYVELPPPPYQAEMVVTSQPQARTS